MSMIITTTKAKRLTLMYQCLAVICVLGGVAIGVIGLPQSVALTELNRVSQPPTASILDFNDDSTDQDLESQSASKRIRIDPRSIAERLAMLDNAPQTSSIENEIPALENPIEDAPAEDGALAKRIQYTGYINDSDMPLAFIRIDGNQRIVAEGGIARSGVLGLDDLTIRAVRPKFILVTDGQAEDRIKISSKSGPSITMSSGADVVVSSVPQREEDVILTQDEIDQLDKYSARERPMQERILRRKKMGKEIGGIRKEPLATYRASAGSSRRNKKPQEND